MAKNAETTQEELKDNGVNVEHPQSEETTEVILPSFDTYVGKEADEITHLLMKRSDVKNYANLPITNVVDNSHMTIAPDGSFVSKGNKVTLVLSKPIPQYRDDEFGDRPLDTTNRNFFTNVIAITAVLKQQGKMVIAAALAKDASILPAILQGAKISLFGIEQPAGSVYQNPYATRLRDEDTFAEKDSIQYHPYEIILAPDSEVLSAIAMFKALR